MDTSLQALLASYDPAAPLAEAWTLPASFYTDPRLLELERHTVFSRSWQVVGRGDQLQAPGCYLTAEVAGEPVVVVRGADGALRAFFNVCRHHGAAVMSEPQGCAQFLRCPYHGWTYGLDGSLRGAPDFGGVCRFDRAAMGLVPVPVATWEHWVFVRLAGDGSDGPTLDSFLGSDLIQQVHQLDLGRFRFFERRRYHLDCNWKVFVDNYLDGGYHVPQLHAGLASVLDYAAYTIDHGERFCLQASPLVSAGAEPETGAVRRGDRALYYWIYPNFMINWYKDALDTNLVLPLGLERTEVVFDFYFTDVSPAAQAHNRASIAVAERIQDEDRAICCSVQRGLRSRAYGAGRLSVRREAGEHLFHRLLHADLCQGMDRPSP